MRTHMYTHFVTVICIDINHVVCVYVYIYIHTYRYTCTYTYVCIPSCCVNDGLQ